MTKKTNKVMYCPFCKANSYQELPNDGTDIIAEQESNVFDVITAYRCGTDNSHFFYVSEEDV